MSAIIVRPGRFDETIYCDLPNAQARKEFFTRFSNKHEITFTEEALAQLISSSQGMSSAEIEQVFREAIYQAVGDNKALTSENIKQTMIRVSYGLPSDHIILRKKKSVVPLTMKLVTYYFQKYYFLNNQLILSLLSLVMEH